MFVSFYKQAHIHTVHVITMSSYFIKKKKNCKNLIRMNIEINVLKPKVPYAYAQSIFKEVFVKFGPKKIFSVEPLRPLVSVNNDFSKFFIFEVVKKLVNIFTSLRI
jgi:hypothetical protein